MKTVLIPASLLIAFGLAGCGGGGGGSSTTPITPALTVAPQGAVGGTNIGLTVTATGAQVTFPCGTTGAITKPLTLDANGNFNEPGTITPPGTTPTVITANYAGHTDGKTIHLTVTAISTTIGSSQTYDLTYGVAPTITATCSH